MRAAQAENEVGVDRIRSVQDGKVARLYVYAVLVKIAVAVHFAISI